MRYSFSVAAAVHIITFVHNNSSTGRGRAEICVSASPVFIAQLLFLESLGVRRLFVNIHLLFGLRINRISFRRPLGEECTAVEMEHHQYSTRHTRCINEMISVRKTCILYIASIRFVAEDFCLIEAERFFFVSGINSRR